MRAANRVAPAHPDLSLQEFNRSARDGPMVSIGELEADKLCNVVIVERADPAADLAESGR